MFIATVFSMAKKLFQYPYRRMEKKIVVYSYNGITTQQ